MARNIGGTVKDGVVVPDASLPEGARVEIVVLDGSTMPAELQEEIAAWDRASDRALDLVDRLARGEQPNDQR